MSNGKQLSSGTWFKTSSVRWKRSAENFRTSRSRLLNRRLEDMAEHQNHEQIAIFGMEPSRRTKSRPTCRLAGREKARKKTNGYEPPNLGKAIRLPVPDFSDPDRPPVCLEVDFPIAPINALSNLEGNAGKPIYQMSKWWARRRSSVFRSLLIAAATEAPGDPPRRLNESGTITTATTRRPGIFASSGCSTSSWEAGPRWSKARALASRWRALISIPWPGS